MKVYSQNQLDEFEKKRKEHQEDNERLKKENTFFDKLGGILSYYGVYIAIGGFFLIASVYLVIITFFSSKPDYEILIAAKKSQTSVDLSALISELEEYGEDVNGDGKVIVHFTNCVADGDVDDLLGAGNAMTTFTAEVEADDKIFYIVDDVRLKEMKGMLIKESKPFVSIDGQDAVSWLGTDLEKNTKSEYDGHMYFVVRNFSKTNKKIEKAQNSAVDLIKRIRDNKKTVKDK
jgi:hypothetical protein